MVMRWKGGRGVTVKHHHAGHGLKHEDFVEAQSG